MSTPRILWIIWCSLWAMIWVTFGWLLFPINIGMFMLSLALIIPACVGQPRTVAVWTTQGYPPPVYPPVRQLPR